MQKIKLCLLDFDGTLFNTIESLYPVFVNSFKEVGITIKDEDCLQLTRVRLSEGFHMHGGKDEDIQIYYNAIEKYLNSEETVKATKIFDDTIKFLELSKKKKLDLGIVTSNNTCHVKDVLRFFNIDENNFKTYVGNRESRIHKPKPDPIFVALEQYSREINKEEVIYVGDAMADMECAEAAGVIPVYLDRNNEKLSNKYIRITSLLDILDLEV